MGIETTRLILHAIDEAEARRICRADGEQRPFGYYQIIRAADRLAVGGVGFKGPPRSGSVEVGYGLAPSARGHGYAGEALTALLTVAAQHGVATVLATPPTTTSPPSEHLPTQGSLLSAPTPNCSTTRSGRPDP